MQTARLAVLLALALSSVSRADDAPRPSPLLRAAELRPLVDARSVKTIDVRSLEDYAAGHLPGAVHLDRRTFDNPTQDKDGRVVAPDVLAGLLSARGVTNQDALVVYSGVKSLQMATRLWWLLSAYGHTGVRVLDGGLEAWTAGGHPLETGAPPAAPASSTYVCGSFDAAQLADADAVSARAPSCVLLDVRTPEEFAGGKVSDGAARGGHIPGAVHVFYKDALGADGLLEPVEELRALYAAKGIGPDTEVIVYCMRAHRASHTFFVLRELLGVKRARIYNGSWIEWSHTDRPIEAGQPAR